jgi:hypothetical protein
MSDFQTPEISDIVPRQTEAIVPLDEIKSFFYQLNAKPDTEIRLLPGKKTLELADIRSINEQVAAKLMNHDITAEIASINFILSNKRSKTIVLGLSLRGKIGTLLMKKFKPLLSNGIF